MPPELEPDDNYVSEEDSDFAPEDAPAEESSASGDEDEEAPGAKPAAGERKRPAGAKEEAVAEDAGFENSGDEAIIVKGKKRRKKTKEDDDEGGEGGLIKTRSMRAVEKAEKRANTAIGPVTVDIDALWAQMTSEPIVPPSIPQPSADTIKHPSSLQPQQPTEASTESSSNDKTELIRIKRTYNFAGKVHTEEKLVARDSAEAKLYLAENPDAAIETEEPEQPKRILKKAFRSAFEPITPGMDAQRRSDLNLGMAARLQAREELAAGAKKLNTVEKSRMDWAGFVDKEGIKDELELAGKSKHSFVSRQDFLARSEAVREDEARKARISGRV
ncbi:bucentaur or craniofacial development-domain-containing protein [Cladorrhinum sp. PSN259]|nr:bucentaur or craniofacial development-domain-containing protein [Cladorrhinum sp. PSN259]